MRLRAKWVLPDSATVLEDGEVIIENGLLVEVRARRIDGQPCTEARDLGNAILLPGLVNAHTHLEYTVLRGAVEDIPMFPWLDRLMELKALLEPDDWIASAICGAADAARGGVTTVADCTDSGAAAHGLSAVGLRGIVYQEVFGIGEDVPVEVALERLRTKLAVLARHTDPTLVRVGISPHSVYTVRPALLRAAAQYAQEHRLPVCIHAAESQPEVELLLAGTGVRAARLKERRIDWKAPRMGVLRYLADLDVLGPSTLLVHCVSLTSEDMEILQRSGSAVAYCPRSNAKLGNGAAHLATLITHTTTEASRAIGALGACVGLGTDSAVSSNNADMFEEMRLGLLVQRAMWRRAETPVAGDMLALATQGGARALELDRLIGSLHVGKAADLTAVRVGQRMQPCYHPVQAVVHAAACHDVMLTMVNGEIVAERGRVHCERLTWARRRMRQAAHRIQRACLM